MKRLTVFLLALIMLLGCAACGAEEKTPETLSFESGIIDGSVYTSTLGGISFTAPKGYEYFTDEMIEEAFGITAETLDIDNVTSTVYDMYCYNEESRSSISVSFENLAMTHGVDCTQEEYIDDCMTSYKITFNSFEDVILQAIEEATVNIDGTEYPAIHMVLDNDGEVFYESLLIKKVENYMMSCIIAAYSQEELENIISGITEI